MSTSRTSPRAWPSICQAVRRRAHAAGGRLRQVDARRPHQLRHLSRGGQPGSITSASRPTTPPSWPSSRPAPRPPTWPCWTKHHHHLLLRRKRKALGDRPAGRGLGALPPSRTSDLQPKAFEVVCCVLHTPRGKPSASRQVRLVLLLSPMITHVLILCTHNSRAQRAVSACSTTGPPSSAKTCAPTAPAVRPVARINPSPGGPAGCGHRHVPHRSRAGTGVQRR